MSTAYAIAGVTAFLMDLLNRGLSDADISGAVDGAVQVTALAPSHIKTDQANLRTLNLFLYQVNPNQGWRNQGLPSRDAGGTRTTNPPLALDLGYLLTAYTASDLRGEILLGHALQIFHEVPGVGRGALGTAFDSIDSEPLKTALQTSELSGQLEQLKLCPHYLNSEEMSKLWTAFQAPYHPSMAYQVSVVLIEAKRRTKPTLPVLERRLHVMPFNQPQIETVLSQTAPNEPIKEQPILLGHTLVLRGQNLRGQITRVRIGGEAVEPTAVSATEVQLRLATPPLAADILRAGVQPVQVVHDLDFATPNEPHRGFDSNAMALVLRPRATPGAIGGGRLTVNFEPNVGREQRVVLLLDGPTAMRIAAPQHNGIANPAQTSTAQIQFPLTNVPGGSYLLRVQVDGAESLLEVDPITKTFNAPRVTIP